MEQQSKYALQLKKERSLRDYIPFSSHADEKTILTKGGDFIRTWRVGGISFETVDADDIFLKCKQLNTLYRSLASSHVAIWSHIVRREIRDRLVSHFDNAFCRQFDEKYYASFEGDNYRMMGNELYLSVIYRPHPSKVARLFGKSPTRTAEEIRQDTLRCLMKMDELCLQIESTFKSYDAQLLTTYEEDGILYSDTLTFYNYLLTGIWQKIRVPKTPLYEYLGNSWLFMGTETIEIRTPEKTRFAQCIDFKDYDQHTEPGLLNSLMYEDYEYVITQSFSFLDKRDGMEFLRRQQKQLISAEDGSDSQVMEISEAIEQLTNGEFSMGQYHFSMMVFAESVEGVTKNRNAAMSLIRDQGFLASLVNTATDAAFFAQLPANWRYRPRIATLTSLNFAGFASFHNFSAGKRDGNPWGQAVTLFKTPSGQPLYFNFHYSKLNFDAFDKKLLGNARVIGQSGSGKTVLLNMLLTQIQKYAYKAPMGFGTVFFDKDHGAEILIRAIGGKYLAFETGRPTGLNPFQIDPTEENILFLEKLVRTLVTIPGTPLTIDEELRISHAVRTVMRMDKPIRRLSIVLQNITEGNSREERENSIAKRLSKWCDGGAFAWVFDNDEDVIDFTGCNNFGFDGTAFLDDPDVRTPISMYLLFRTESIIDGRRFAYFMDEAWKWVDDEAFADFAGNKQLTIRKQNGFGVFATQMPSSLLNSKIASALVQQVATEIYLPNPKADYKEYVEGFKVSDAEFEIIKNMGEESRMFLIKQGHQSMIGSLVLNGFDDELNVLSGSTDNIELLHEILADTGDDPDVWLPIFYQKIHERNQRSIRKERR